MGNNGYKDGTGYCAYNFQNRPALIWGVPFGIFMAGFGVMTISAGLGFLLLPFIYALVLPLLSALTLLTVRSVCKNDPNALRFLTARLQGIFFRGLGTPSGIFILSPLDFTGEKECEKYAKRFYLSVRGEKA